MPQDWFQIVIFKKYTVDLKFEVFFPLTVGHQLLATLSNISHATGCYTSSKQNREIPLFKLAKCTQNASYPFFPFFIVYSWTVQFRFIHFICKHFRNINIFFWKYWIITFIMRVEQRYPSENSLMHVTVV